MVVPSRPRSRRQQQVRGNRLVILHMRVTKDALNNISSILQIRLTILHTYQLFSLCAVPSFHLMMN